jgi:hypothetical protein
VTEGIHLLPYFEPHDTRAQSALAAGSDYVAGFRCDDGHHWGLHIPVAAAIVEMAVLKRAAFTIGLEPDGRVLLRSSGLSDGALDDAAKLSLLPTCSVTERVTACVNPVELRREENPRADLTVLRQDLAVALKLVDDPLAFLERP